MKNEADKVRLKAYVLAFYDVQKMRVSLANRLGVKANGRSQKRRTYSDPELMKMYEQSESEEKRLKAIIKKQLITFDIYTDYLQDVHGVGEMMSAVLISYLDPYKAGTVSSFYQYAGLAPTHFDQYQRKLKDKLIHVLAESFLRCSSPYRQYYDDYKHRKESSSVVRSKSHIHQMSLRYMVKMFLRDLWVKWRTFENLETRCMYAEEYLERKHHDGI